MSEDIEPKFRWFSRPVIVTLAFYAIVTWCISFVFLMTLFPVRAIMTGAIGINLYEVVATLDRGFTEAVYTSAAISIVGGVPYAFVVLLAKRTEELSTEQEIDAIQRERGDCE